MIKEIFLSKEFLHKHANNYVQMSPQWIVQFVFHEWKSGESVFIFHKSKH